MAAQKQIGVVDDDERVLESMEALLASVGYGVHLYASAEAFLDGPHLNDMDCLISDVGMPGMTGFDLLAQVMRLRPDLPVILITARHEDRLSQTAIRGGARYFFEKPFDTRELLRATAAVLGASTP
jgi:FixJ family two-component response regulator